MDREAELAVVRRAYAKQIMVPFDITHPRVEAAFAAVRREHFLGPGPWPLLHLRGYVRTPSDDPVYLYQDLLVGIIPDRGLNNCRPSFHAMLIARADARPGEHVVHIGAGTGYFTATRDGLRRSNSMPSLPSAWPPILPASPMCARCRAMARRSISAPPT